ncbi:MAG: type II toxin-antitoxin system RelE/ParE family toxin [Treponema sp.]|jgi:hypothetical protein|nr:type II toxin-antitoxin system RelE/ParE family toxin [Treponema sp.]
MRIFKNRWFTRFARKEGIGNDELKEIVRQAESGQYDVNLGGNVYKYRVARPGKGDSGGYRVIVFFKSGERMFFVYGFAKSDMANINEKEKRLYKEMAKDLLALTDKQINARVDDGRFEEILI